MELLIRNPAFLMVVVLFVIGEALWRTRIARRSYAVTGAFASFGMAIGNVVFKPLNAAIIGAAFMAVYAAAPMKLPLEDWRVWVVGFAAVEFVYYWFHRWSHTVRWLWASHAVHHTASEMTLPTAIRLGWTGALSGGWILFTPLVALGFHPVMVSALIAGNLAYQFFLHTEAVGRLGPLEWVLNTPSHHRVHHASNPEYIDRNFGGVVIIFDRLFGTFAGERGDVPLRYGLVHAMTSNNPVEIALHEWTRMVRELGGVRTLHDVWRVLFGRPA
jgi:sterol desaturase/sphingolipid hydroxylase (fatty acid hydroxylase superfamily)